MIRDQLSNAPKTSMKAKQVAAPTLRLIRRRSRTAICGTL